MLDPLFVKHIDLLSQLFFLVLQVGYLKYKLLLFNRWNGYFKIFQYRLGYGGH